MPGLRHLPSNGAVSGSHSIATTRASQDSHGTCRSAIDPRVAHADHLILLRFRGSNHIDASINLVLRSAHAQTSLRSLRKLDCGARSSKDGHRRDRASGILRDGAPQVGCSRRFRRGQHLPTQRLDQAHAAGSARQELRCAAMFARVPDPSELYIFPAPVPGPLSSDKIAGATQVPQSFSHRMMAQTPIRTKSGTVRITDSKVFPVSTTIAAALVEVAPGAMRELHWHPNTDEWQYYIEGQARMGVFAASGQARTFDFQANDVGYVPFAMGHYIENTGNTMLRFLEIFKSDYYADVSLDQWLALTPPELVGAHLRSDPQLIRALRKDKVPVVPA